MQDYGQWLPQRGEEDTVPPSKQCPLPSATRQTYRQHRRNGIERDLEQGIRDNDYLQDENADRLREALNALERCDVRCYSLESKVDELAWFVGGDAEKIRQLQGKLNELSVGEQLKEDGVYGKKTEKAVAEFMQQLLHGSVPTLTWVDPLQSSFSSVYSKKIPNTNVSALWDFSQRSANPNKGIVVFRVDEPHGSFNYRHINTVEGRSIKSGKYNPSEFQRANIPAHRKALPAGQSGRPQLPPPRR